MQNPTITYEQPLNERIRTFLRLEDLFDQTRHSMKGNNMWDSRASLASTLEILNIFERNDIKNEIVKELERHCNNLQKLEASAEVDKHKLDHILKKLSLHTRTLQQLPGKIGQSLKDIELLSSVRQRLGIPGGTCSFDLPFYHYWLQQPHAIRIANLESWFDEFVPLQQALDVILGLTRNSAEPDNEVAIDGFYQKPLEPQTPCQMVRVTLPTNSKIFPEISGSKHRISIRFMQSNGTSRPTPFEKDIDFELSCCFI